MADLSEQRHSLEITGPDGLLQSVEILEGVSVLGRKTGVTILLHNDMVSREHAKIERQAEECAITDLNSSNGTKVNGDWLVPGVSQVLRDGDVIDIDPFRLVVRITAVVPSQQTALPETTPDPPPIDSIPIDHQLEVPAPTPPTNGQIAVTPMPTEYSPPPGLTINDSHYLQFLPDIYYTTFMARFLALFESIYRPIEWTVDNFDQFLHPRTAPVGFLPWLASWFELLLDTSWSEAQKRLLLTEAYQIYSQRGTITAIHRIVEIYTGQKPEIDDQSEGLAPFTFTVKLPAEVSAQKAQIEVLLNQHKPAYTSYTLSFA